MKKIVHGVAAAIALASCLSANAAIVTSSQTQTFDGQDFTFALSTPGYLANTASSLTLNLQADFNGEAGEFVTVIIEGVNQGTFGYDSPGSYNKTTWNFNGRTFSLDFALNNLFTNAALADGDLDVFIDFNFGVTAECGWQNASNCLTEGVAPFAALSYAYQTAQQQVPEPASLALIGLGLAGAAVARRRKAKRA